jgi:hypothetical protein
MPARRMRMKERVMCTRTRWRMWTASSSSFIRATTHPRRLDATAVWTVRRGTQRLHRLRRRQRRRAALRSVFAAHRCRTSIRQRVDRRCHLGGVRHPSRRNHDGRALLPGRFHQLERGRDQRRPIILGCSSVRGPSADRCHLARCQRRSDPQPHRPVELESAVTLSTAR